MGIEVFIIVPTPFAVLVPLRRFRQTFAVPTYDIAGYVIKNHIFNVGSIRVNTVDGYLFTIPILITAFYGNGNFYQVAVILRKVGIKASQSVLCRVQLTVFLLNALYDIFRYRS